MRIQDWRSGESSRDWEEVGEVWGLLVREPVSGGGGVSGAGCRMEALRVIKLVVRREGIPAGMVQWAAVRDWTSEGRGSVPRVMKKRSQGEAGWRRGWTERCSGRMIQRITLAMRRVVRVEERRVEMKADGEEDGWKATRWRVQAGMLRKIEVEQAL